MTINTSSMVSGEKFLPEGLSFFNPIVVGDLARMGSKGDGGYVLPASRLAGIDAVISFGVKTNWTIEESLAAGRPELPIHAYDHTVNGNVFLQGAVLELIKLFLFRSSPGNVLRNIHTYRSYKNFFRGNHAHFQKRITNRRDFDFDATIEDVFARMEGKTRIFLKMDIEGSEYRVIPDILRFADRIDMMSIEFHDTEPLRPVFIEHARHLCEHFDVVHLHANNNVGVAKDGLPDVLEITLLNKRLGTKGPRRDRLPVAGLDFPNDPRKPEIPIVFAATKPAR